MALSVDDLRTFILVSSERSVSRASAHLGVTQQSVSERIRRLERRVGVELFVRLPHGMQPSGAGFRLLPYARQAVELVDRALAVIDAEDLVRVRVQRSVSGFLLPLLAEGATRVDSAVDDDAASALAAVAAGSADVAIGVFTADEAAPFTVEPGLQGPPGAEPVGGPAPAHGAADERRSEGSGDEGDAGDPGSATTDETAADQAARAAVAGIDPVESTLVVDHLLDDPVVWVAPPNHPLAGRDQALPGAELAALSVGVTASGAAEGNGAAVDEESEGLRIAPRSTVAEALAEGRLVEVAVDLPGWVVPISIAYRSSDHDRPTIAALRADLASQSAAGGLPLK